MKSSRHNLKLICFLAAILAIGLLAYSALGIGLYFTSHDTQMQITEDANEQFSCQLEHNENLQVPIGGFIRVEYVFRFAYNEYRSAAGIHLILEDKETNFTYDRVVLPAKFGDFPLSIPKDNDTRDTNKPSLRFTSNIDIPNDPRLVGKTLSGTLRGDCVLPFPYHGGYVPREYSINLPVQVSVSNPGEYRNINAQVHNAASIYICLPLGILFLICCLVLQSKIRNAGDNGYKFYRFKSY